MNTKAILVDGGVIIKHMNIPRRPKIYLAGPPSSLLFSDFEASKEIPPTNATIVHYEFDYTFSEDGFDYYLRNTKLSHLLYYQTSKNSPIKNLIRSDLDIQKICEEILAHYLKGIHNISTIEYLSSHIAKEIKRAIGI